MTYQQQRAMSLLQTMGWKWNQIMKDRDRIVLMQRIPFRSGVWTRTVATISPYGGVKMGDEDGRYEK